MNRNFSISILCLLIVILGCGRFGNNAVSNDQLATDLDGKPLKFPDEKNPWYLSKDVEWCFQVNDKETTITDANADVSLAVSSWRETEPPLRLFLTLSGAMIMHYKKDGGKWILDRIEPKSAITDSFEEKSKFDKFLSDKHIPVCKGYRHSGF